MKTLKLTKEETEKLEKNGYLILSRYGFRLAVVESKDAPNTYTLSVESPYKKIKKTY